jgi:O-antigen/teichoic acid export membrane protein
MVGHGLSQAVRLGASLILTRLLFPEAYGLMALAQVFLVGLKMFSDLGLKPAIIYSMRGHDPEFLNTAWTIQIIRGFVLWAGAALLAIPASRFYDQPQLLPILIALGSTAAIQGFETTATFTAFKRINLGRITLIDLASQLIGIIAMITWARIEPTVWALAGGGIIGAAARTLLGFRILDGHAHKITWNRSCAREILGFGIWIFISSIIGFLSNNGDRLILGRFLDSDDLGMYQLALNLATLAAILHGRITDMVLVPFFAERRAQDRMRLRKDLARMRWALGSLLAAPCCFLVVFGSDVITILYDDRYENAGWKLQVLAVGAAWTVATDIGNYLLSFGRPKLFTLTILVKTFCTIGAMATGGALHGPAGLIIGVSCGPILYYPFHVFFARRHGVWIGLVDLTFISALGITLAIAAARAGLIPGI